MDPPTLKVIPAPLQLKQTDLIRYGARARIVLPSLACSDKTTRVFAFFERGRGIRRSDPGLGTGTKLLKWKEESLMRKTLLRSEQKATPKCGPGAEPDPSRQIVKHRQRKLAQTHDAGATSC